MSRAPVYIYLKDHNGKSVISVTLIVAWSLHRLRQKTKNIEQQLCGWENLVNKTSHMKKATLVWAATKVIETQSLITTTVSTKASQHDKTMTMKWIINSCINWMICMMFFLHCTAATWLMDSNVQLRVFLIKWILHVYKILPICFAHSHTEASAH